MSESLFSLFRTQERLALFKSGKTGLKNVHHTFWLCFKKKNKKKIANCSLQKGRKEQFTLLKRVKEQFALFCQKTSDLRENQRANS